MSTVHNVLALVKADEQAMALAIENDVHTAAAKLKVWYEDLYGKIQQDLIDWHWIATAAKNQANVDPTVIGEPGVTGENDATTNVAGIPESGNAYPSPSSDASPVAGESGAPGGETGHTLMN